MRIRVFVSAWMLILTTQLGLYAQISGISARAFPRQITASQLPIANGTQGLRIVTDALSDSSCSIGGGIIKLICFDNGSWTVVGLGVEGSQGEQGPPGEDGQSASIEIGTVTTGVAGSSASIVNSGTSLDAIFDFTIPRGDKGETGDQGPQGDDGPQGAVGPQGATGSQGPAGPVAGSDTQVIFNDNGAAAGDSGLTFSKTLDALTLGGSITLPAGSVSSSSLRIVQSGTGLWQPTVNTLGFTSNGIETLRLNTATNGVNYIEITPQATGGGSANGPTIKATGSDSSVDLNFDVKGTSPRYQFKINGVTRADYTDIGGGAFFFRNSVGGYYGTIFGDALNHLRAANGGNWVDLKGNGVLGLRVSDSAATTSVRMVTSVQPTIIADNGNAGTRAISTLTPTTSYISITCNDSNGCTVTLSETGAIDGQILRIACVTSNICGFVDTLGVNEMSGDFDMGQYDSLSLLYVSDRWVETARSNN